MTGDMRKIGNLRKTGYIRQTKERRRDTGDLRQEKLDTRLETGDR